MRRGISEWLPGWRKNGWKTSLKKPVKNEDLWRTLDLAAMKHKIQWHWLKGHAGHAANERCDQLTQIEIEKIKKKFSTAELKTSLAQFVVQQEKSSDGVAT